MKVSVETWRAIPTEAGRDAVLRDMEPEERLQLKRELLASPPPGATPAEAAPIPAAAAPVPAAAPAQPIETPTGTSTPTPAQAPPGTTALGAGLTGGLQGATFNTSEEIGGGIRQLIPGGEDYQTYVNRQRALQAQQRAEHPGAYLAGELGGAIGSTFVPVAGWVAGPARAVQAGRLAAAGRGALTAGAEATVAAVGGNEGNLGERVAGVSPLEVGTAMGLGVAGETLLGPLIGRVTKQWGANTARSVEKNLRALADQTGLKTDEIVQRIANGEVFAGMTESTRVAARAIKDKSATAGSIMTDATRGRVAARQGEAFSTAERVLVPGLAGTDNLHRAATEQLERQAREAGQTFGAARDAAVASDPTALSGIISTAVQREPAIARDLNDFYRLTGQPPLFDAQGAFLRQPTVADAEHLTRRLGEIGEGLASPMNPSASRMSSAAIGELQRELRGVVDAQAGTMIGPGPLIGPRQATSRALEAQNEGYPLGRGMLTKTPEEFAVEYGGLAAPGQEAARMGAATSIRARAAQRATPNTLIDQLLTSQFPGQNLRTMVGDAGMEQVGPTLERAKGEQVLLDRLVGGPNTAERLAAQEALTTRNANTGNAFDALEQLTQSGGISGVTKMLRTVLGSSQDLDDRQLQELANYMMSTDPDLMRSALAGDKVAAKNVRRVVNNLSGKLGRRQLAAVAGAAPNALGLDLDSIFQGSHP